MAARKKTTKTTKKSSAKKPTKVAETAMLDSLPVEESPRPRRSVKKYARLFIVLAVLLTLLYLGKGLLIAATVNGYPISRLEVLRQLEKNAGQQALDNAVTKTIIFQEARKANVSVSNEEINSEVDKIKKELEGQGTTLDATLSLQGQTEQDLRENIEIRKILEKVLGDKVAVSDEEVKKYYDENKELFQDKSFDDVKDQVKDQLVQQKLTTEFQTWISDKRTNAKVNYFVRY